MDESVKDDIGALARKAHDLTEAAYRTLPATRGDPLWQEKQRLLLADMALHLVQTAVRGGDLSPASLEQNLYAILTVSEQFLPERGLKAAADRLLTAPPSS